MVRTWIQEWGPQILIILTLGTIAFGASFYIYQLAATPAALWIFVPDCPLYATLASGVLLLGWPRSPTLRLCIASACALYGSWTLMVFGVYASFYFSAEQLVPTTILAIGHIGMLIQALLVLPRREELGRLAIGVTLGWLLLNTFVDYRVGDLSTHPWVTEPIHPFIEPFTWAASVLWPLALFALAGWIGQNEQIQELRAALRLHVAVLKMEMLKKA